MTKRIVAVTTPLAAHPSRPPMNSIMAAAKTAHDLDIAHRKAAKAKGLRYASNRSPTGQFRAIPPARGRDESLIQFVVRVGRLIAVQFQERGK